MLIVDVIRKLPWYLAAPNRAFIGAVRWSPSFKRGVAKYRGVAGDARGDDQPRVDGASVSTVGFGVDGFGCALICESAEGRHRQDRSGIRR